MPLAHAENIHLQIKIVLSESTILPNAHGYIRSSEITNLPNAHGSKEDKSKQLRLHAVLTP